MMHRILVVLALAAGCKDSKLEEAAKKPESKAETAGPPPGFVAHENWPMVYLEVPKDAKAVENKFGVGWFETPDKSFAITYKPAEHADMARMKSATGELVATWVREEQQADGFILGYTSKDDGLYGLQMVRTLNGKLMKCSTGSAKDEAGLAAVIAACSSLRL